MPVFGNSRYGSGRWSMLNWLQGMVAAGHSTSRVIPRERRRVINDFATCLHEKGSRSATSCFRNCNRQSENGGYCLRSIFHQRRFRRVEQLLRDIDRGFWNFCTSYNNSWPITGRKVDPIVQEFLDLDPFPWTEVEPNTFARIGSAPPDLIMAVSVEYLRRPWLKARHPSRASDF
jgi:hypothetical protein